MNAEKVLINIFTNRYELARLQTFSIADCTNLIDCEANLRVDIVKTSILVLEGNREVGLTISLEFRK